MVVIRGALVTKLAIEKHLTKHYTSESNTKLFEDNKEKWLRNNVYLGPFPLREHRNKKEPRQQISKKKKREETLGIINIVYVEEFLENN